MFEGKDKDMVAEKLVMMYGKDDQKKKDEDPRYEELMTKFDRMNKVFTL